MTNDTPPAGTTPTPDDTHPQCPVCNCTSYAHSVCAVCSTPIGLHTPCRPAQPLPAKGEGEWAADVADLFGLIQYINANVPYRSYADLFTIDNVKSLRRFASAIAMAIEAWKPQTGAKTFGDRPADHPELAGFKWLPFEMRLLHQDTGHVVASVWQNGVWHTWDAIGVGGENAGNDTIDEAKTSAEAAVVRQGWHKDLPTREQFHEVEYDRDQLKHSVTLLRDVLTEVRDHGEVPHQVRERCKERLEDTEIEE